jgi:hypothetical protein
VSRLCFLLSSPKHRIYKDLNGLMREDLVFQNARPGKGIGGIPIACEFHNGECGEKFATRWETKPFPAEDFYDVTIHNLNDALVSIMKEWNERNPDNTYTDAIVIDHFLDMKTHIHLAMEQFSHLLQVNWKEHFLKLTLSTKQSIEELKLGFSEEEKKTLREGRELVFDDIKLEIKDYEIEKEELPNNTMQRSVGPTAFHIMNRIFRYVFGR